MSAPHATELAELRDLETVPSERVSALWDSLDPALVDDIAGGRPTTLLSVMNGRGTVADGEHLWFLLDRED